MNDLLVIIAGIVFLVWLCRKEPPSIQEEAMISKSILAKIHVAKKQLGMDDDSYRAMLRALGGVDSARDLSASGATRVLRHLEHSGFKPTRPSTSNRPLAGDAQSGKIRALWLELHRLGAVHNSSEEALAAYVKRQTGVDALQWLTSPQASQIIEAMKRWVTRVETGSAA